MTPARRFWLTHLAVPGAVFALIAVALERSGFDLMLADRLYALQGGNWSLKEHFLTSVVLHRWGRNLLALCWLAVVVAAIAANWSMRLRPYRRGLWYLALVLAVAPGLVNLLKGITHVDCPWDLQRYGGAVPYVPLFSAHPGTFRYGQCFPSAHASGGFALLGLYFFARRHAPSARWIALGVALGIGTIYGFAQQLRGAHFLSHDLWALAVCWLTALALAQWLLRPPQDQAPASP